MRLGAFAGVFCIIAFQYASYAYFLLTVLSFQYPIAALVLMVVLSALVLMIFWTYSYAVFRNPGYMPLIKEDQLEIAKPELEASKKKSSHIKQKVSPLLPVA